MNALKLSLRQNPALGVVIAMMTVYFVIANVWPRDSALNLVGILGLPLALGCPGYALSHALVPGKKASIVERLMLTLGLSIAVLVITGLGLHVSTLGMSTPNFVAGICIVTIASAITALVRYALSANNWRDDTDQAKRMPVVFRLNVPVCILAAFIAGGAVALAVHTANTVPPSDIVQLWMLPVTKNTSTQAAAQAAAQVAKQTPTQIQIGIHNVAAPESAYALQLMRSGYVLQEWPALSVTPGKTWQVTVTVNSSWPGSGPVEAVLYRQSAPGQAFRQVSFWPGSQSASSQSSP